MDPTAKLMFFEDLSSYSSSESESEIMGVEEDEVMLMVAEWITSTDAKSKRPVS